MLLSEPVGMTERTLSGDEARKVMDLVQKIRRKIECKALTARVNTANNF